MALSRSLPLLLVLVVVALILPKTTAETLLAQSCEGSNYTANSEFRSNLQLLLASLSASNSYFSTDVVGSSSKAYGLVMCRGDVDPDDCKACVHTASENITQLCVRSKQAIVLYDRCQLRYSDARFFSSSRDGWIILMYNVGDFQRDPEASTAAAKRLMGKVADRAARNVSSPLLFADGTIAYRSDLPVIYGLAQCTSDLSSGICRQCLQQILDVYWSSAYASKKGGRILGYSCNFRYEIYPFFAGDPTISLGATAASAASLSPSPTPVTNVQVATQSGEGEDSYLHSNLFFKIFYLQHGGSSWI
ncbi:cysteine-rich receptor-like protein kinase 10 [Iris pallida]|uniref:Cysteine-rich receptor-like protein kinase 10 n=1 Tax=Iris pallida TaxID=29817 RepID=A0AAX6DXN7_IRIPA|nr:cysteine-rich receptor-like protein kinase 10 [Iris pallida]